MGGGWCLASLLDSVSLPLPTPNPWPSDILTEDDVYCSCLAKTLCHVPVPVTVGFYAPFGCRLHLMLDKITGEDPCMLWVAVQEIGLWSLPAPGFPKIHWPQRPACPSADAHKSAFTTSLPIPTAPAPRSLLQFPLWPPGIQSCPSPLPNPLEGICLNYRSSPVVPLLKSLLWLPSTLGRKPSFLTDTASSCQVSSGLCVPPDPSLLFSPGSGPSAHNSPNR